MTAASGVVVSQTGRVHIAKERNGTSPWFHTACGQWLTGWTPKPDQRLAVSCKRCREA